MTNFYKGKTNMTPENFCYWLQGLLEVGDPTTLNQNQIKIIQEHLNLVFTKLTPDIADQKATQQILSDLFKQNKTLLPYKPDGLYYPNILPLIKKGKDDLVITC